MLLIDEIAGNDAKEVGHAPTTKLTISVRKLLHMRVELEWQVRDKTRERKGDALPKTSNTREQRLNTSAISAGLGLFADTSEAQKLDQMFAIAEQAFVDQRVLVLLDNRQVQSLDEVVDVKHTATATFLLLTPLQGG